MEIKLGSPNIKTSSSIPPLWMHSQGRVATWAPHAFPIQINHATTAPFTSTIVEALTGSGKCPVSWA